MAMHTKLLLQMVVVTFLFGKAASDELMSLPNCPTKCGSVTIPFPFGTTEDCSLDNTFLINCNQTSSTSTHIPFLPQTNQTVLNISLNGELRVAWPVASDCYDEKVKRVNRTYWEINMTHFQVSSSQNKLTGIGCDTVAAVVGIDYEGNNYTTGCVTLCNRFDDISSFNGSCFGTGCCEISIPQGRKLSEVVYLSRSVFNNHSAVHDFNPCGYSFLVEDGGYSFASTDLFRLQKKEFPVVLDWAVGNETCRQDQKNASSYASV